MTKKMLALVMGAILLLAAAGCSSNQPVASNQPTVIMVQGTVSQYLLARALEKAGLGDSKVKILNMDDDQIAGAMLGSASQKACVTWNPMVLEILGSKNAGVTKIFDSSKIPGEIQDLLVVNTGTLDQNPNLARALVGAWYQEMAKMNDGGPAAEKAIARMAKLSSPTCTTANFKSQLATTAFYKTPADAVAFAESKDIQAKNDLVRHFCYQHHMLGDNATSADVVGIQYPDGTVQGDPHAINMRYSSIYMKEVRDGKKYAPSVVSSKKTFKVAISIYAGWMPYYLMMEDGTLQQWADKYGIQIEFQPMSYPASLDAYDAGKVDACLMTNMELLDMPAKAGVDSTAIVVGDYSNGNDAVLVRDGLTLKDLAGKR